VRFGADKGDVDPRDVIPSHEFLGSARY